MLKNPQDRRALRTTAQIKETLFALMEHKEIHQISVAEICKVCQINRATFYDHYRDIFDLAQDLETDVLLDIQALMERIAQQQTEAETVSGQFFDFLTEHRQRLLRLLRNERSTDFSLRLDALLMPFFEKRVRQSYHIPPGADEELHRILQFASAGYYRFFFRVLEEESLDLSKEAALCAKLSDAYLSLYFTPKSL